MSRKTVPSGVPFHNVQYARVSLEEHAELFHALLNTLRSAKRPTAALEVVRSIQVIQNEMATPCRFSRNG